MSFTQQHSGEPWQPAVKKPQPAIAKWVKEDARVEEILLQQAPETLPIGAGLGRRWTAMDAGSAAKAQVGGPHLALCRLPRPSISPTQLAWLQSSTG